MVCSSAQSLDRAHKNGPKYVRSMAHSGDDNASVWCYVRSLVGRSRGGGCSTIYGPGLAPISRPMICGPGHLRCHLLPGPRRFLQ